ALPICTPGARVGEWRGQWAAQYRSLDGEVERVRGAVGVASGEPGVGGDHLLEAAAQQVDEVPLRGAQPVEEVDGQEFRLVPAQRVEHRVGPEFLGDVAHELGEVIGVAGLGGEAVDGRGQLAREQVGEERGDVLPVPVQGGPSDTGAPRDLDHRGAPGTDLEEGVAGGGEGAVATGCALAGLATAGLPDCAARRADCRHRVSSLQTRPRTRHRSTGAENVLLFQYD